MNKLLGALLLALFVFTGCQNDDEQKKDLTPDEAAALVHGTTDKLSDDVVSLVESEGTQAMIDFMNLLEGSTVIGGRVDQKEWTKERLSLITQYFINGPAARTNNDDPSSFDDIKGLYEWNPEIQDFDKEASEFFIVKFPTEGSSTNNAELKISKLEFVTITEVYDDFVDEYEVPSIIEGYLKVDNVTFIQLDFEVNWSSTGTPEKADVTLLVSPFSFVLKFDDTFAQSASLMSSISIEDEVIVGIDLTVKFESNNKEEVEFLEGFVNYRDLKITGNVDLTDISDDADPNDYINLALFSGDTKIGDIVFVLEEIEPGYEDYVAYVEYSDGSKENLEEILEPVLAEIEETFEEFEG